MHLSRNSVLSCICAHKSEAIFVCRVHRSKCIQLWPRSCSRWWHMQLRSWHSRGNWSIRRLEVLCHQYCVPSLDQQLQGRYYRAFRLQEHRIFIQWACFSKRHQQTGENNCFRIVCLLNFCLMHQGQVLQAKEKRPPATSRPYPLHKFGMATSHTNPDSKMVYAANPGQHFMIYILDSGKLIQFNMLCALLLWNAVCCLVAGPSSVSKTC